MESDDDRDTFELDESAEEEAAAGLRSEYSQMEFAPQEYKLCTMVNCSGIHWAPPLKHLTCNFESRHLYCVFFYFLNGPIPSSFSFISVIFKQTLQFLQQINVNNIHPVSSAGIRTHNLLITSLLP